MNSATTQPDSRDNLSQFTPGHDEGGGLDLRGLLATLLGGLPVLAGTVVLFLAGALFHLFITPPIFSADSLIQVEESANDARFSFMESGGMMAPETPVAAELEILRSRLVLGQVVDRLGLDIVASSKTFPIVGEGFARRHSGDGFGTAPWILKPFDRASYAWGGEVIKVTTFGVPAAWVGKTFSLIAEGEGRYRIIDRNGGAILAGEIGKLESATISLQGIEEEESTERFEIFVRQLAAKPGTEFKLQRRPRDVAVRSIQNRLSTTASRSATGIVNLVFNSTAPKQARDVLNEILAVYQSQNIERRSEEAQQTLTFLNEQLPEMKSEVESAEARINQFKVENSTADLTQETAIVLERSVELDQQRGDLNQQRDEALQKFTENHPVVQAIDSQLNQLDRERNRVAERIRSLPDIEQEALQLQRDLQVSTALYVALLNRTQELEVVKSGTIGSIRIIDVPLVPRNASKPKHSTTLVLSVLLGLIAGIAAVIVLEALRSGVEDPAVTERQLGLATYGSIPYSPVQGRLARRLLRSSGGDPLILALEDPDSITMEAFRSVRTALHFARMDAPNNVIMLTGPAPDLGKSFVSVNMGAVLAQAGDRTVVIDADMRRGHIHKMLGIPERSPGLSDVLAGTAPLEAAIRSTSINDLSVITTGQIPPNPSELLVNPRFIELLEQLSAQFKHVIIDTPPVLAVTDAAIVGKHAGISLLVLKAGEHPLRMIDDTLNRLQRAGVVVKGALFTQVGLSRKGRYGYKYGYRYGNYQYNYSPKKQKSSEA